MGNMGNMGNMNMNMGMGNMGNMGNMNMGNMGMGGMGMGGMGGGCGCLACNGMVELIGSISGGGFLDIPWQLKRQLVEPRTRHAATSATHGPNVRKVRGKLYIYQSTISATFEGTPRRISNLFKNVAFVPRLQLTLWYSNMFQPYQWCRMRWLGHNWSRGWMAPKKSGLVQVISLNIFHISSKSSIPLVMANQPPPYIHTQKLRVSPFTVFVFHQKIRVFLTAGLKWKPCGGWLLGPRPWRFWTPSRPMQGPAFGVREAEGMGMEEFPLIFFLPGL